VAQELLRHASARITLDVYAQAVTPEKRRAQSKVAEMLRAGKAMKENLYWTLLDPDVLAVGFQQSREGAPDGVPANSLGDLRPRRRRTDAPLQDGHRGCKAPSPSSSFL
jgi:hypothetical protein